MEFLRRALNPWGENVPIGVSWDLIWAAVIVGAAFVVGHALLVPKKAGAARIDESEARGLPDRIQRHTAGARGFHWSMSATMFVLLITAFFPVIGIQFPWVTIHWIAGVALILTVLYHIWHVFAKQDFWTMWIGRRDIEEGKLGLKVALGRSGAGEAGAGKSGEDESDEGGSGGKRPRAGKYPVDQKMFHHAAMIVTIGAVVTGILMMFRIDNFLWAENTYMFSDAAWGWIYVIHGICGIGLIFLVIAHVYFAIRPEKRWMTWSMIHGLIDREKYLQNHDPKRWVVAESGSGAVGADGD